ncbi:retrovirus-related pol polyprotein from transposon TNT 1-94 [Tanacetum coccineum]
MQLRNRPKPSPPFVPVPHTERRAVLSTEKLLLTLMDEVKSLKEQIKVPSDNSPSVSQTRSSKSSKAVKAFRVFNIRRQEMEETYHVTISEDDEAISQSSTEGDAIKFNENRSFLDDEFLEPRNKVIQCSGNIEYFPYILVYETIHENITLIDSPILQDTISPEEPPEFTNNIINEPISDVQPSPTISPSAKGILQSPVPQGRWSRENHIKLVNIIGEHLAGITTRSKVRDSKDASAHVCMYVNFLSKKEPKKLIEALEEEGWIIAMQEELNKFERNKVWTLVPKLHGKTIIGTKWIWKNKMDENRVVIKNKIRLISQGYNQQKGVDYEETLAHVARLEAIGIFLAYAAYMEYLKGTLNLGLWYPKGSGFDLEAYSDSDYAGCNLDRKTEADSTTKLITFTLSHFKKPLSFDLDVFSTVIMLEHSEDIVSISPKETVKAGLETLGLTDEMDNISYSSLTLISSSREIKYFSPKWRFP